MFYFGYAVGLCSVTFILLLLCQYSNFEKLELRCSAQCSDSARILGTVHAENSILRFWLSTTRQILQRPKLD